MNVVSDIIPAIKKDLAAKMPSILAAFNVPDFDAYTVGYPTDQNKAFCCVRFNRADRSAGSAAFTFTVHLQLPGMEEEKAYYYIDAAAGYLSDFETNDYSFYGGSFIVEMLDNFRVSDTQVFFDYTMTDVMDDCD